MPFPESWDERLRHFDDSVINYVQAPLTRQTPLRKLYEYGALLMTMFTCIEFGLCLPIFFHVLGYDALGTRSTILVLVSAFFSQLPKRFVWRARPWMLGRARKLRKDSTSSFPSRAVTCGVVYGFILGQMTNLKDPAWDIIIPCAVVFGALAAFARIYLGAHYPSDCLVGYLSGIVACAIGIGLLYGEESACGSCYEFTCYSNPDNDALPITHSSLGDMDHRPFVILVLVFAFMVFVLMSPPLVFWGKLSHPAGVLLPILTFRLTFLCPTIGTVHYALPPPSAATPASAFVALTLSLITMFLGKKTKRCKMLKKYLTYLLLYWITLISLISWRLYYLR